MQQGDFFVLILLLIVILLWAVFLIKQHRKIPLQKQWSPDMDEDIPLSEAVALLEEEGYEVMTQKRKVPIQITINDEELLQSRLFVDHFVKQSGLLYVVKLAKAQRPLEMTGSGIRDHLLAYQLLYQDIAGVLYVDAELGTIHKIQFEIDR